MDLSDLQLKLNGLTILTDTLDLNSWWLLKTFVDEDTLVVTFREPVQLQNSIDLSRSLFSVSNGRFSAISLENLATEIKNRNPKRLVLEHPDMLVSSGTVSAGTLLDWIDAVSPRQCIISLCVYSALLESTLNTHKAASKLAISLLHTAYLQLKVQPLSTGFSTEYNGTLEQVSGPLAVSKYHKTWLFRIEKDAVTLCLR